MFFVVLFISTGFLWLCVFALVWILELITRYWIFTKWKRELIEFPLSEYPYSDCITGKPYKILNSVAMPDYKHPLLEEGEIFYRLTLQLCTGEIFESDSTHYHLSRTSNY